ncbi:MAG: L-threonylcarbamoyladenylate synthase [Alkalinema sp. CAN_BIN05]|nr:L-threonylcarbamoyladenylate synthase [Alkalinema sp. CAN_BIN05]
MPQVTIDQWVQHLRQGAIGSFPTDTVPALSAHPDFADQIYTIKSRSAEKPLILMAGDSQDLWPYLASDRHDSTNCQAHWQTMMDTYFPGALTLVLPKRDRTLLKLNPSQTGTIGVRVPNYDPARTILRQTGPLATTSVNRSGEPALLNMTDIRSQFPKIYTLSDLALKELGSVEPDISPITPPLPSTVIEWIGNGWMILRQGAIVFSDTEKDIHRILN